MEFRCTEHSGFRWHVVLSWGVPAGLLFLSGCVGLLPRGKGVPDPGKGNLVYVSWGDQIMVGRGDALLDAPERIRRQFDCWNRGYDGKAVLWRMSSVCLKRFYKRRTTSDFIKRYNATVDRIYREFDPIAVARESAHRNGMEFLLYMTFQDHGAPTTELYGGVTPFPWQDRVTLEKPYLQTVDRNGNYHYGVLELAYPEARRIMVERMRAFVEEFRADGLYVCPRTHSLPALHADQFGFSKPVVAEYAKRYGIDILEDPRFDYRSPAFAPADPAVERWRRLRGEYRVQFYRELRGALPGKTIYAGIPRGRYLGPPFGNLYLDWESLVREKLVDGLVLRVYSGAGLHTPLRVPHDSIGYLSSEDDHFGVPEPETAVSEVYGPLCARHGVKCFFNTGRLTPRDKRWVETEALLAGLMLNCPTGRPAVYIKHDDRLCGNGGPLTVEAFVYINSPPKNKHYPRIVSKYGHERDTLRGWEWMLQPDGRFRFRMNQDGVGKKGMGGDATLVSKRVLPVRTWIHVATVFDPVAGRARLFLDGRLDAERSVPRLPLRINRDQILSLGAYGGTGSQVFDGKIDELRFLTQAPATCVVPKIPYSGLVDDTVALYHFDSVASGENAFVDSTPGHALPAGLIGMEKHAVSPSCPGFGRCLDFTEHSPAPALPGRNDLTRPRRSR